jgi:Arc/MetJ-type ribon-helix-helix transcriptional regulator
MAKRVSVNWKVSAELKAWIDAHVELGEYADPGACVEDAFRRLEEYRTHEPIDEALDRAYSSGKGREYTKADWERLRQDARRFAAAYQRTAARRRSA